MKFAGTGDLHSPTDCLVKYMISDHMNFGKPVFLFLYASSIALPMSVRIYLFSNCTHFVAS